MTQLDTFSKLSTTLEQFNNTLETSDKLDKKALQTIQLYLKDPEVKILDKDEQKMQRPLKQLELLTDKATLTRVSSTLMKQIDRQLINLAELIIKDPQESKKHPFFIIVKLEVCFLKILSADAINSSNARRKKYEERMARTETIEGSPATSHSDAQHMDRQQQIINELMNAALFDVIEYFEKQNIDFSEKFTQEFLDLLNKKAKDRNFSLQDKKMADDVFNILSKTAENCNLTMPVLIIKLKYAIIGYSETINEYTIPLQDYILNTQSPSLEAFNKTLKSSSALSTEEVNQFNSLFQLYCKILLAHQQGGKESETDVPAPPVECDSDLKFIWVTPNVQDYYKDFETVILPAMVADYTVKELSLDNADEWKEGRIFLCLNAKNARDLLPHIHNENEIYRIYVVCQNKAEEDEFQLEKNKFNKIRTATKEKQVLIRQLALDIVDSFIDLRNLKYKNKDYVGANRWHEAAIKKVTDYGGEKKESLLANIKKKIEQPS